MIPVMIVEDEFLVRAGLRTSIDWNAEGFEIVAEAQNGEEALELYQRYHPLIIITDIRLPKMDGIAMMKELRKQKAKVNFIVVSAYDDFQYAKEAIGIGVANYFLKGDLDVSEFLKTLHGLFKEPHEDAKGGILEHQNTLKALYQSKDVAEFISREWKEPPSSIYLLHFRAKNANPRMLEAMVCDLLSGKDTRCMKLEEEGGSWFLYAGTAEGQDKVAEELSHMFRRYVDEEITIIRSENLFQYPDMKEAVYHVLLSYEYASNPAYRLRGGGQESEKEAVRQIRSAENSLAEKLRFQKYEEAQKQLEELKIRIVTLSSPAALSASVYRLLGVLAECDEELHASRVYDNLMSSLSLSGIYRTLSSLIEDLQMKNEDDNNIYVLKVKEFIEQNYREPIRIKDLSDYIHVSPNYLGKLFYVNTGEHLRDYINSVKLEKAKKLLSARKYQISEVASMVGIEDQRYFSKLFKKSYGVSPKEFGK